jgi:hypothetical protein
MKQTAGGRAGQRAVAARTSEDRSSLDEWSDKIELLLASRRVRSIGVVAVFALVTAIRFTLGIELAVLVLAGVALLTVIWLTWLSLQSLAGETPLSLEEAIGMSAPSAEEERKRSVLRALKDLEYERSVGKISEQDYLELSNRYRDEAKVLMRALAEGSSHDRSTVERVVAERLSGLGLPPAESEPRPKRAETADDEPDAKAEEPDEPAPQREAVSPPVDDEPAATRAETAKDRVLGPTRKCGACSTRNDLDAEFCKHCGQRMASNQQVLCRSCPSVYDRTEGACPACGVRQEAE